MNEVLARAEKMIGAEFESEPVRIDRDRRQQFEDSTFITELYDESSPELGYPDDLIPGFQTLSLIDALTHGFLERDPSMVGLNYGLDRVRFVKAARLDGSYKARAKVVETAERGPAVQLKLEVELVEVPSGDTVVFAEWLVMQVPNDSIS